MNPGSPLPRLAVPGPSARDSGKLYNNAHVVYDGKQSHKQLLRRVTVGTSARSREDSAP